MDISTVVDFVKEAAPVLNSMGFAMFLVLYAKIRDLDSSIALLDSKLAQYLMRTEDCEKEIKELTSFIYAHYNLTPAEALKYLHRHQGCQSIEK